MSNPKVPSHGDTDFTDVQSITLIGNLLASHKRVMPKLESNDKWPNIDGHVEVQNGEKSLVGRLFVQAKTLPANHKLKFSCPIGFFTSCEIDPCLLLGVDNQTRRVYWLYFDAQTVQEIDYKNNKSTKTVYFKSTQYFDETKREYIEAWEGIVKSNQYKFKNYDELKSSYDLLSKNSNQAIGKVSDHYVKLHKFLDNLNLLLDSDFAVVKNIYYPKTWKLGIAVYDFEDSKLSYALYPILFNKNDAQIKEVDKVLHDSLQQEGLGFTGHFVENPIVSKPLEYVKELLSSKTFNLVDKTLLNYLGSEFLAQEYVCNFIITHNDRIGLQKKDKYTISEVKDSPWLKKLQNTRVLYIDGKQINMYVFFNFLDYLEKNGLDIVRQYKPKDFSRIPNGGWVWEVFSKVDVEYNLQLVFQNLGSVYQSIIKNNFPLLSDKLSLFGAADKIFVSFAVKEKYQGYGSGPTYSMFYVKSVNPSGLQQIEIIGEDEGKLFQKTAFQSGNHDILHDGVKYQIISMRHSVLDFIYEDTPMFKLVNGILLNRLKDYFKD